MSAPTITPCLDKGYVRLVTYTPRDMVALEDAIARRDMDAARALLCDHDLTPVNTARASFMKESTSFEPRDARLLRFLATAEPVPHDSPFRHAVMTFEVKAPLMVARQWFKYRVGSRHGPDAAELVGAPQAALDWLGGVGDDGGFDDMLYARNEASRRYITIEPEFYVPAVWRGAPANARQGSAAPLPDDEAMRQTARLRGTILAALDGYHAALAAGVCAEEARLFLPAYALYTVWRWTASLQAVCHFLTQRLDSHAQSQIREYARAVYRLAEPRFPRSIAALVPPHDTTE